MCIAFLLLGWQGYAQQADLAEQVHKSFSAAYLQATGSQAIIYSGKEPIAYPPYYNGHPYLEAIEPAVGTLVYDHIVYPDVRMRLDLNRDELIVSVPGGYNNVVLQPDKYNYADLHGYRLIYFYPDGLKGCPGQGYYQQLHDGLYPVLEKRTATFSESIKGLEREFTFDQSTRFYICKDNVYYAVKSKGSVLKVFKSHKKVLNQFAKQHKLNFRKETGKAIVAIVEEYERIAKQP